MSHFKHSSITDLAKNVDKYMYEPAYIVNPVHHRALHPGLHVLREVCCILQNALHDFLDWQDYCIDSGKIYYKNPTKIVKLLAKSKLKSLPYNHTDHLPTHPPLTLN